MGAVMPIRRSGWYADVQRQAASLFFDFSIDRLTPGSPIVIHQDSVGQTK
jgi:hypothetical protein